MNACYPNNIYRSFIVFGIFLLWLNLSYHDATGYLMTAVGIFLPVCCFYMAFHYRLTFKENELVVRSHFFRLRVYRYAEYQFVFGPTMKVRSGPGPWHVPSRCLTVYRLNEQGELMDSQQHRFEFAVTLKLRQKIYMTLQQRLQRLELNHHLKAVEMDQTYYY